MDSLGARFSGAKYIKVDIDFSSGENVVTMITETDGTPVTATGEITWGSGEGSLRGSSSEVQNIKSKKSGE